ncbi:MAG: hypothetical protein K0R39_1110, partial [Symbiobacteriaceae bacterium]|nr:hypothetical protein [Symbiobacteriaceae bacterium]
MLFRFVTTIPRVLNWSVILSLLTLLIKIVLLNRLPESFPGANQLGIVVEGILGSMVASYVFYLVVVHTKEIKDKQA